MTTTLDSQIDIVNRLGLHARAAAKFVQTANEYDADVELIKADNGNQKVVNGKSILGVMMLAAAKGTQLTLRTSGEDAEAANAALTALVEDKFGEGE